MKRLRWESPGTNRSVPKHPYRDSAVLYAILAVLVVVVAAATGGGVGRAVVFAAAAFLLATAWSWRNWRNRLREEEMRKQEERSR
jgi:Flp pilus assembly protein TadB